MNPFGGKGHIVYMDRFYTSLPVIRTLEEMKIGTVGTCMRNRLGLSEDLNKEIKKLGKGQFNYYERDNVMLTVYQDAKTVFLLSNIDQVKQTRVTRKIRKKELVPGSNKFTETVNIPSAIAKYNQQARGVDILDQYINYYMFPHKSLKWYFRIIIFLLEISLLNSWVLFTDTQQKRDEKTISFLSYRRKVGKDLIKDFTVLRGVSTTPLKKKIDKPSAENIELWDRCHLGKGTKRKCSHCRLHKTSFCCEKCEIPLCTIPCYDMHTYNQSNKS